MVYFFPPSAKKDMRDSYNNILQVFTLCFIMPNQQTSPYSLFLIADLKQAFPEKFCPQCAANHFMTNKTKIGFKGYLHCKTITSQNVPSEAKVKNFFIL